jgi:hypothetical protein
MSDEIQFSAKETELKALSTKKMTQKKKRYYVPNENDDLTKTFNSGLKALNEIDLINKHGVKFSLHYVYPAISKRTWAHIIKTSPQLKMYSGIDVLIEVSGEVWELIDQEQKNILLEHELAHLHLTENDEGILNIRLLQHDLQDFKKIISKYGVEWTQQCDLIKTQLVEIANERKAKQKELVKNSGKKCGRPRTRYLTVG